MPQKVKIAIGAAWLALGCKQRAKINNMHLSWLKVEERLTSSLLVFVRGIHILQYCMKCVKHYVNIAKGTLLLSVVCLYALGSIKEHIRPLTNVFHFTQYGASFSLPQQLKHQACNRTNPLFIHCYLFTSYLLQPGKLISCS